MGENESEKRKAVPPYISFKTFLSFLDSMQVGIPSHVDRSVLRSLSGAAQSGLLMALNFMGLVETSGVPTERLAKIVEAKHDERRQLLAQLWRDIYGKLPVDFSVTTPKQLDDALATTGVTGETIEKCRAFLMAMAHNAGITLSPHLKRKYRRTNASKSRRPTRQQGLALPHDEVDDEENGGPDLRQQTPEQMLIDILDPEQMSEEEQQAVWTLIKFLKRQPIE